MKRRQTRPSLVSECVQAKTDLTADLIDGGGTIAFALQTAPYGGWTHPMGRDDSTNLRRKWALSMRVSENIAVTRDLATLILAAGDDLPDDATVEHHHLFTEHGFVYFDQPLKDEVHEYPIRALTFHHGRGVSYRFGDERLLAGVEINLWSEIRNDTRIGSGRFLPAGSDFLPYGLPSIGWSEVHEGLPDVKLSQASRFVLVLQAFMRDELPARAAWPVPKTMRRGLDRVELPHTGITVIDLRRRASRPTFDSIADEKAWTLTNRHVVRGHWAKRWVGPKHRAHSKTTEDKEAIYVYIHPFVKGPEDAPFAMTEKVNRVSR